MKRITVSIKKPVRKYSYEERNKENILNYAIEKVRIITLNFINYTFEEKIENSFVIKEDE